MVTCTGHIGIHEGAEGRTYVHTVVHDIMAIKPNFLTSMGYHIFLTMVLRDVLGFRFLRLAKLKQSQILLSFGHFNFNRKRKQTAVINIFIL